MFTQTLNAVIGRPLVSALLGALSARPAAALLVTPFVHLWTAGPATITPLNVPADFTEATYAGYAAQSLTLPLLGPINLDAETDGVYNQVSFIAGAVVPPGQMIAGYWVDELAAAGTLLYLAERFPSPIPITVLGDSIVIDIIEGIKAILTL